VKDYRKGEISKETYDRQVFAFIRECICKQEELGLDVLVHGEYERNDMVEFFGENLAGYIFTEKAWVQSYGTRCVKPPIIFVLCFLVMIVSTIILGVIQNEYVVNWASGNQAIAKVILMPINILYVLVFDLI
jgi:hypothetical protein